MVHAAHFNRQGQEAQCTPLRCGVSPPPEVALPACLLNAHVACLRVEDDEIAQRWRVVPEHGVERAQEGEQRRELLCKVTRERREKRQHNAWTVKPTARNGNTTVSYGHRRRAA